jgi:hypothetical protein
MMPGLFEASDDIGTIHYSRFTVLSEKTLLFLGDFDGEFGQLMNGLAKKAGPVFDAIFEYVEGPPATPVADHPDAFVEWTAEHLVHPLNTYTAYPEVTVQEIKALASAAARVARVRSPVEKRACVQTAVIHHNYHNRERPEQCSGL